MRRRIQGSGCEVESVPFPGEAIRGSRFLMAGKTPGKVLYEVNFVFLVEEVFCFENVFLFFLRGRFFGF